MRAHMTEVLYWCFWVNLFHFLEHLLLANFFDVLKYGHDLLRLGKVVFALSQEKAANLIVVVR